jgi:ABC-type branched-subunit amino acid transport system ATPase component/ABC-type branched-subunit amino acid transport system permease subunit
VNLGSLTLGVLNGLLDGLLAVGIVLVYRSSRFLNLAHGQIGALPALLVAKLVIDEGWSYWAALAVAILVGVGTAIVVERVFIAPLRRRSSSSTSLLLMSLAVTQLLAALVFITAFSPDQGKLAGFGYPVPFDVSYRFGGVVLGGQDVMVAILCPLLVVGLAVFLRYSLMGKMIRAVAANPENARLCGISPRLVSMVTWGIAGGLSAVTAVLTAASHASGFNAAALGPHQLLIALGAAAFGAFTSVPLALVGGLTLGIVNQVTLGITSNGGTASVVVFVVILLVVFVRGGRLEAAFSQSGTTVDDRAPLRVPAALAGRPLVRAHRPALVGLGLLGALMLPFVPGLRSEGHRFQLTLVLVYALVAISLTMLLGWGGQLSLGHFALVGMGAFLSARLVPHGWNVEPLLLFSGVLGAAVMTLVGIPALRIRGVTLAVTTLGLGVVSSEWLFHEHWFTGSSGAVLTVSPIRILPHTTPSGSYLSVYLLALVVLAVAAFLAQGLRRSTPGRLLIAVRDNERTAAAHGIAPATTKLATLALSGFIAGAAGVLWADAWQTVSPMAFTPDVSLAMLTAPVIGGLGSIAGAIAGAVVLYLPAYFISPHITGLFGKFASQLAFQLAFGGLSMAGILLAYPTGIAGATQALWEKLLARVARELPEEEEKGPGQPVLEVRDVRLTFGGIRALDGVTLHVAPGEIVGLIGPNGAGKSTLLNTISGVLRPSSGTVGVLGTEVGGLSPELRAALGLGRSFQAAELFAGLTVRETVSAVIGSRAGIGMLGSMFRAPWAIRAERAAQAEGDELIARLGLDAWADTLTTALSTGTRRVCDLALQLADKPAVLLLDEPTAGLAQRESEAFVPLLRQVREELGCAILIVEHDMPLLMGVCDRVYAMDAGHVIAEGTPEHVRSDPAVISSYLGTSDVAISRSGSSAGTVPPQGPKRPRRTVKEKQTS